MAYSTQRAVSDGTLQLLALSIIFFDKTEITVYLDNIPTTAYTWATANSIHFNAPVPTGVEALIRRTTDLSEVRHVFSLGAQFKDSTLDEDFRQILHIAQEAVEGANVGDIYSTLNMHGNTIANVGPAVADGDAISLGQVRTESLGAYAASIAAQAAASSALTSKGASEAAAAAAAASAGTATTQAGTATTQAGNSAASATASDSARAAAVVAQNSAASSSTLAQKWAAEVEDTVVTGGLYSAFHYSRKASASATASANSAADAAASAGSINLPSITGKARQVLRAKGDESGLEYSPVVGTVTQSAGVATGAIVERGSNANGSWTKFADGRMICEMRRTRTTAVNAAYGSMFFNGGPAAEPFPQTFVSIPFINILAEGAAIWTAPIGLTTTTTWPTYYLLSGVARASSPIVEVFYASGFWY